MSTALYSVLHFLVDFSCAHAMFREFLNGTDGYANILLYNFCAFALQMPIGTALDWFADRCRRLPAFIAALGVAVTILGGFTHSTVLGLGNALFHVGGGIGTIQEDNANGWKGRALGVFVAPGALGLFLGTRLAKNVYIIPILIAAMSICILPLFFLRQIPDAGYSQIRRPKSCLPLLCCFLVVILRSFVGMAVTFEWKQEPALALAAILAVVLGKAAGGLAAAQFGTRNTVVVSLALAATCYFLGNQAVFGIGALFFFNMTMPVTLYQLALRHPGLPGFSFGLLTFALFLGFLPVYAGFEVPISGTALGALGSLLSLVLLLPVARKDGL